MCNCNTFLTPNYSTSRIHLSQMPSPSVAIHTTTHPLTQMHSLSARTCSVKTHTLTAASSRVHSFDILSISNGYSSELKIISFLIQCSVDCFQCYFYEFSFSRPYWLFKRFSHHTFSVNIGCLFRALSWTIRFVACKCECYAMQPNIYVYGVD